MSGRAWREPKTAAAILKSITETVSDAYALAIVNWTDGGDKRGISACKDGWWLLFEWDEGGPLSTMWLGSLSDVRIAESRSYLTRNLTKNGDVFPAAWGPLERLELTHHCFPGGKLVVELEVFAPDAREEIRERLLRACGWAWLWTGQVF